MYEPSTISLKSLQKRHESVWQMYEAGTVDALKKQHQTIFQMFGAGLVDEDQATECLIRVGIALRRASRAGSLTE